VVEVLRRCARDRTWRHRHHRRDCRYGVAPQELNGQLRLANAELSSLAEALSCGAGLGIRVADMGSGYEKGSGLSGVWVTGFWAVGLRTCKQ
jgi:hypothetical protein